LKQYDRMYSDFRAVLKRLHIHPFSFSKYCMGVVLTDPNAKYNRFKSKLMKIRKLTKDDTIRLS